MSKKYQKYISILQKKADIDYASALLSWDKETYMPTKGAQYRDRQVATLSGIAHEMFTDKKFGKLLRKLNGSKNLDKRQSRNIQLSLKEYSRIEKLNTEFVIRRSKTISKTYNAWLEARNTNDYQIFKEPLRELIDIKREEARLIGYDGHPYDALLDEFEPGMTVEKLDQLFSDVRAQLVDFVKKVKSKKQVKNDFLKKFYPKDKQWQFGLDILKNMGYDFERGRQDVSTHPFTINFSSDDVRVTTRIDENDFSNMTWSCIHEGGHALYEQGIPSEEYGLPLGTYLTLGIHESQSRLWENHVGRSLNYWKFHYPKLQEVFQKNLRDISLDDFYKGINRVEPNLIRTEADELHYHFHVMIRYEIEKQLIEGSIEVDDLDQFWNKKYKEYLGVDVPDAKRGILQDIHWSLGSFGYFPTYSIGSFYAAQMYAIAKREIPNLDQQIENGNCKNLLSWLSDKIHQHGKFYSADELSKNISGETLNFSYFMNYCENKYRNIYDF